MSAFIHLHVHSYYSFFDSTLSPRQIVEFAQARGATHIALTDTNSFTGIMEFNLLCRDAGISPVLGVEVRQPLDVHRKMLAKRAWKYRTEDDRQEDAPDLQYTQHAPSLSPHESRSSGSPMLWHGDTNCRAVLLARNMEGYKVISHLLTRRHTDAGFDLMNEVRNLPASVVLLSDCLVILEAAAAAGCDAYGELIASPRRRRQNRKLYEFCLQRGVPMIIAADAKMLSPDEKKTHNLLRAMGTLTTIDNLPDAEKIDPWQHLVTQQALRDLFLLDRPPLQELEDYQNHLEEAYHNTTRIAHSCQCELPYRQWHFPRLKSEGKDPVNTLAELTRQGIRDRYGNSPSDEVIQRTGRELDIIRNLGFTEYFLLVHQIIEEARRRDYFTIGRGSAANSIVTYALGISNVCPVKYNLYFERFLNPERSSPPDVDLDFSWRERDDLIDWCFEHFGRDNVALISTISTLRYRQAIREVAKAMGVPPADVDRFNRLSETGHKVAEGNRHRDYSKEEPWVTIMAVAERINGFPHHLSVHCGGIVIAPFPVVDLMPLTLSAKGYAITQMDMIGVEDLGLMKMDLLGNRSLGVLKDILTMGQANGGRNYDEMPHGKNTTTPNDGRDEVFRREATRMKLSGTRRGTSVALAGALHNLEGQNGDSVESYARPMRERIRDFQHVTNDPWTRRLIDEGNTMGCFYIESPGMRALFERLRCQSYEDVVAASSIIRPGVAESGMMKEYIDRHQQTRNSLDLRSPLTLMPASNGSNRMATGTLPLNAHSKARRAPATRPVSQRAKAPVISETMKQMLPETHGVMVYQEDVLKVAHDLAGMSFAEADILRRAISGKLRSSESILKIQQRFLDGCQSHHGLQAAEAEEVWRQLSSFAGYSFCKGHSAAFAVLSYQIAYLKAHFPAEFFAAVLTNQGGFYGAGAYTEEARRWGVKTLPPCVNQSHVEYRGKTLCSLPVDGPLPVGSADNRGWIRPGLRFISGLSAHGMQHILSERECRGVFQSLQDFLSRCALYDDEITALIKSGACDGFSSEPTGVCRAGGLLQATLLRDRAALNRDSFFEDMSTPASPSVRVQEFSHAEICQMERDHLGYMISGHPMDFIQPPAPTVSACNIRAHAGENVSMVGWGIAAKILAARNNRKLMKMLTLEDRTGTYEAILFPRIYEKFAPCTLTRGPYLVTGKVDVSLGSPTLNVRSIKLLESR